MDAYEAIMTRRSIRNYTDKPLAPSTLTDILDAAMAAPSAGNQQPWHFVLITDRAKLDKIPSLHPHASMVPRAQAAILVCGDPTLEKHKDYWVQDCAAATENLLLAAHALGLGAVWTGVYPRMDRVEGLRKLFGIPEHVLPFALIPLGYPAEEKGRAGRYDEGRIHKNQWGGK